MTRVVLVAVLAIALAGCAPAGPESRPTSADQAVREAMIADLLAALERRDGDAIAAMVTPGVDASADIDALLDQFGGLRLRDVRASWLDDFGGAYVVATITGTDDDGSAVTIRAAITREDGGFYLALGHGVADGPVSNPNSPAP